MNTIKIFLVGENVEVNSEIATKIKAITSVDFMIFQRGRECIDHLASNPAIIFIDYYLSDPGFDAVMRVISSFNPSPKVVILAGKNEVNIANELMREDVHDIIVKDSTQLDHMLQVILKQKGRRPTSFEQTKKIHTPLEANNFIANSPVMQTVMQAVDLYPQNENTLWIQGQPGTGKESIARMIHMNSKHSSAPFIKVDINHIPQEHVKNALFGIAKVNGDRSYFDRCDNGTIYIENVDKLSRENQMHLFSAIGKHTIYDEVNAKNIPINSRIIVATVNDIENSVREGRFHESLFKTLHNNKIVVPVLGKRGNDIVHIAQKLLNDYSRRSNVPGLKLSQDSCLKLSQYSFPGNIAELKSVIEYAAVLAENNVINVDAIVFSGQSEHMNWINQELTLEEFNSKLIHHYLNKYDNKVKLVADKLAIGKSTIYRMLQKESTPGSEEK